MSLPGESRQKATARPVRQTVQGGLGQGLRLPERTSLQGDLGPSPESSPARGRLPQLLEKRQHEGFSVFLDFTHSSHHARYLGPIVSNDCGPLEDGLFHAAKISQEIARLHGEKRRTAEFAPASLEDGQRPFGTEDPAIRPRYLSIRLGKRPSAVHPVFCRVLEALLVVELGIHPELEESRDRSVRIQVREALGEGQNLMNTALSPKDSLQSGDAAGGRRPFAHEAA